VAVAAIDAVVHNVVFMAEGHRLVDRSTDIGDVRRTDVQLQYREQDNDAKQ
jgi:hypothetical protein